MAGSFERLAERVRNWGRWGDDDQRGTLNHIGPETLRNAAATVIQGKLFSLGLRFDRDGPQLNGRRFNPLLYPTDLGSPLNPAKPNYSYSDDVIHMPLQSATQWDALSHVHYDGVLYNGFKACDALTLKGALRCGVEHLASPGIMSRGLLLDVARLKNVDVLPPGYAVTVADLRSAADRQGVTLGAGDVVLVRTGHIRRFTVDRDRAAFMGAQPGVAAECAEWLWENKAAAVAADNVAVEVLAADRATHEIPLPFHMLALRDMGCPLGEMFDLEALAADCAADGRYAFLLSAPPLAVTGAFGSPVNPLALK